MAVTDTDWTQAIRLALDLSKAHTVEMGTRAYDILHVALAGLNPDRLFVTCDRRQARLAESAGLDTRLAEPAAG